MTIAQEQRKNACEKLEELAEEKLSFKRPVFFIPGWTDEDCTCWVSSYLKRDRCIQQWVGQVVQNCQWVNPISFTEKESESCTSFFDFGDLVKEKVWKKIGTETEFNLVGHSMGGLDAVAAIVDEVEPLWKVHRLITVATPHQGSELGELGPKVRKYSRHHALQCINLDPDQPAIKAVNTLTVRQRLLDRVEKLYCLMGTRDRAVMASARFKKADIDPAQYQRKVEILQIDGATHSQKLGITQDSRTILAILQILLDIELEEPKYSYGYVYQKS